MIYLKLERGVSGYDLQGLGYKSGSLSRARKKAKDIAPKTERQLRVEAKTKRGYTKEQKAAWRKKRREKLISEIGLEALRERLAAERRGQEARRRERETAEVGGAVPGVRADVPCIPASGLRPSGDGEMPGMQDTRGGG